jgi:hypothetical protein
MGHRWNDTDRGKTVVRWGKPLAMPLCPRQTLRGPAYKWSSAFTLRGRRLTPQPWHAHRFGFEWVTGANSEDNHVLICDLVSSGTNSTTLLLRMLELSRWRHFVAPKPREPPSKRCRVIQQKSWIIRFLPWYPEMSPLLSSELRYPNSIKFLFFSII